MSMHYNPTEAEVAAFDVESSPGESFLADDLSIERFIQGVKRQLDAEGDGLIAPGVQSVGLGFYRGSDPDGPHGTFHFTRTADGWSESRKGLPEPLTNGEGTRADTVVYLMSSSASMILLHAAVVQFNAPAFHQSYVAYERAGYVSCFGSNGGNPDTHDTGRNLLIRLLV